MSETVNQPGLATEALTREFATAHAERLAELASQIPGVVYTAEDILAEQKGDRRMGAKWDHSLVVLDGEEPVAFVMGYERASEGNEQYPGNTIYVSELAVAGTHQRRGIAQDLMRAFFAYNNGVGFRELDGALNYSIQTNAADWNGHVVGLYTSFGFTQRALKEYPNRTDVVLGATPAELQL